MITDILTVLWKELKEYLHQRGSTRGMVLMISIPAGIIGIMIPLSAGRMWVDTPISIVYMAWVSMILVTTMIADSFAGERERHTLETLLASRLSDKAIILGKMFSAMGYALLLSLIIVILGLITVNIAYGSGELLLFPLSFTLAGAVMCFLTAFMMSTIGALVSLKSPTVRQAHQTLSFGVIALWFVPMIVMKLLPKNVVNIFLNRLNTVNPTLMTVTFMGVFFILDIVLLVVVMARFKRTRLIFD
ncbi:ABC transporter permease [Candidatus Latescibacterota bacterium]